MIETLASIYGPSYASTIVYMLQSTEYRAGPYLKWYWRTNNFSRVARRKLLDRTRAADLLLIALRTGMILQLAAGLGLFIAGLSGRATGGVEFGLALMLSYPVVWAHLVVVPLLFGRWFIAVPKEKQAVLRSKSVFKKHSAIKIAVAGSYGKTTMKEILLTVLGEGKKVAATPANKNVAPSHAIFAKKLDGDEDILIIEFGEGAPGDVKRFSATTQPNIGVITGLAPAHLDRYKTVEAAGRDIFSLADYLNDQEIYVNTESPSLKSFVKPKHHTYDSSGVMGWKVEDVKLEPNKASFTLKKGERVLKIKSELVGRHQVGPLALAAALADKLGLTKEQIEAGAAKTVPFEHRMQPRLLNGAWIIDDTYNGNIEGIRAGLALLKELKAGRKIYVTPGLVDQGKENERVHKEIGQLIAEAKPDQVVLMRNSVTNWIEQGLEESGYKGELLIKTDPLEFYSNLDQFIAAGDVVLMQNDWTDNYR